jgi:hypothetical protein
MRKIDAPLPADSFDVLMTKLEAFGDYFEHLATTDEQRELAAEFNAFVREIIEATHTHDEEAGRLSPDSEKAEFQKQHGHETLADLFRELREDEMAGKREDAHCYRRDAFKNILDGTTEVAVADKGKDEGIER